MNLHGRISAEKNLFRIKSSGGGKVFWRHIKNYVEWHIFFMLGWCLGLDRYIYQVSADAVVSAKCRYHGKKLADTDAVNHLCSHACLFSSAGDLYNDSRNQIASSPECAEMLIKSILLMRSCNVHRCHRFECSFVLYICIRPIVKILVFAVTEPKK